jgi:CRP-like cAMP-binding protein
MTRRARADRGLLQRAMGGERNTVRAEQMRAVGLSERAIARMIGVRVEAVSRWFKMQDELVLTDDVDGAA